MASKLMAQSSEKNKGYGHKLRLKRNVAPVAVELNIRLLLAPRRIILQFLLKMWATIYAAKKVALSCAIQIAKPPFPVFKTKRVNDILTNTSSHALIVKPLRPSRQIVNK
jgi:hypothetical protein